MGLRLYTQKPGDLSEIMADDDRFGNKVESDLSDILSLESGLLASLPTKGNITAWGRIRRFRTDQKKNLPDSRHSRGAGAPEASEGTVGPVRKQHEWRAMGQAIQFPTKQPTACGARAHPPLHS